MKKLLTLSALLLAALLLFTACPSEPDPNALPGSWPTTVSLYSSTITLFGKAGGGETGTLTPRANKTFVYELPDPTQLASYPNSNSYRLMPCSLTNDSDFTGFEAEATSTAGYYGFAFNITTGTSWSYYILNLSDDSFQIKSVNGSTDDLEIGWTRSAAIRASGTNKILVYKDRNNHIIIKINDELVHTIEDPLFRSGRVGVVCCVTAEECASSDSIGTTFKFLRFQK